MNLHLILEVHDEVIECDVKDKGDLFQILTLAAYRFQSFRFEVTKLVDDDDIPFNCISVMKGWWNI